MPPASALVRCLARVICRVFYRVDCVGRLPAEGAVLLLPNHPNALLDPAVLWATAYRDVRFLAKSTLFEGPLRPLLAGARAIPVYRKLDQGADVSRNSETFAAVDAALSRGDTVCIFPEGMSHSAGRLVPLRSGAARMALSAARAGARVALVPVGLNFERKNAFRSRATVVYGNPFSCEDLIAGGAGPATVGALTERIAQHMRGLLIEADPDGDAALVTRVDRLYAAARGKTGDAQERVERRRVIATGMSRLRVEDPQRYEDVFLRLRRYDQRLARFGLRDRHLDWTVPAGAAARFAARESVMAAVLLPLAAATVLMFAVPYHLTGVAARWLTREPDVAATAQVAAGFVIYPAWLALLASAAWWLGGPRMVLIVAATLPVTAVAGLFAIERESAVIDAVRAWFYLRRTGAGTRARLRRTRSELADVLDEVNGWLTRGGTTEKSTN